MEPLRSLVSVSGAQRVQERGAGGGNKQNADAFRRALEQEAGAAARDAGSAAAEEPVRTKLQEKAGPSRRVDGAAPRHVDVIA